MDLGGSSGGIMKYVIFEYIFMKSGWDWLIDWMLILEKEIFVLNIWIESVVYWGRFGEE